ncbi:MAG: spermidine synthase [Wenzhouxiangellaceae bacterium]|nr:MAG: spermidine synthase [Wenzhouxiangellaceae bacterium]
MSTLLNRQREVPLPLFRHGLLMVFVLSGLAGLIYQSVWAQYLGLMLGHAAYAQALVLATFMGGMGLGAFLAARYSASWRNLIRAYAGVEVLLGLAGLVFHLAFLRIHALALDSLLPLAPGPASAELLKWGLAAALILPQSILLGISFPLMSAGIMRRLPGENGRILGSLYFTNSIGAAVGALIATFVLVPRIGLPGAVQFAGLLNLLVAVAAWMLGSDPHRQSARAIGPSPPPAKHREQTAGQSAAGKLLRLVLVATALSSAASFVYEIGWIRMLSLAVGTTLHAFELMLAAFIGGMALGGLWIRNRADHYARPLVALGWIQLAMGLSAVASLAVYASGAFEWVAYLMEALSRSDAGYTLYNVGTAAAAIVIMLPAAFFAGATLPLFTSLLLRRGHGESVIGKVYAWNTFGAIAGVFFAIHLLIPVLGLRNAMLGAAAIDMLIGLALILAHFQSRRGWPSVAGAAAPAALALVLAATLVEFDPRRLASGVFRSGSPALADSIDVLFLKDGKTASVAVFQGPAPNLRSITYNGKVDAALSMSESQRPTADEPTMVLAAALPLAMHANPRNVAVIGMGSGLTTHVFLADPRPERVETIEIERRMIEGARLFEHRVWRAYDDPRSHMIINDAKSALSSRLTRYDVIISEPTNPWVAGVGNLFATEFHELISQRLTDDGLFLQWIHLYEIDEHLVGSVLAAITPHFPYFRAWLANSSDLMIVASRSPLRPLDHDRLFGGELGAEMRLAGIQSSEQLALREFADGDWLRALSRSLGAPANSYYFPLLSLEAPRTRFRGLNAEAMMNLGAEPPIARQILGIGQPLPHDDAGSGLGHLRAEHETLIARQMLAILRGEASIASTATLLTHSLSLLRLRSADCEQLAGSNELLRSWLVLYSDLAARMLPYLDTEGARPLTSGQDWLLCEQRPEEVVAVLELAEALAARDPGSVELAASRWLDLVLSSNLPDLALSRQAYLAGQAALIAQGRIDEARRFRTFYGPASDAQLTDALLFETLGHYLDELR